MSLSLLHTAVFVYYYSHHCPAQSRVRGCLTRAVLLVLVPLLLHVVVLSDTLRSVSPHCPEISGELEVVLIDSD
jgi:hypothetical protein